MPNFQAKIQVSLRPSVLDPAGEATKSAAIKLGVKGLKKLRIGKSIDIEIEAFTEKEAKSQVEMLSDRLLANPVIEDWSMEFFSDNSSN